MPSERSSTKRIILHNFHLSEILEQANFYVGKRIRAMVASWGVDWEGTLNFGSDSYVL